VRTAPTKRTFRDTKQSPKTSIRSPHTQILVSISFTMSTADETTYGLSQDSAFSPVIREYEINENITPTKNKIKLKRTRPANARYGPRINRGSISHEPLITALRSFTPSMAHAVWKLIPPTKRIALMQADTSCWLQIFDYTCELGTPDNSFLQFDLNF